ncbi:MAG: ribosome silencing factor [Gammaproteobacteria bacterium]|nr:ribosome silencing factor [Gammaproteobacteria bacterium]
MTEQYTSVENLRQLIVDTIDDNKGKNITCIDVQGKSSVTDFMVIATGTSERHVKALADHILEKTKEQGITPIGVEGMKVCDWVLVDLGDVMAHLMLEKTRDYYQLEKLWQPDFEADRVVAIN